MNTLNEYQKLENALLRAGRDFTYPPTPPLAARVRAELVRPSLAPPRPLLRVLVPIAAALLLALVLLFAVPATRDAVAQFLGLRGLIIFYVTPTPTPLPTATPRPSATGAVARIPVTPPHSPTATARPIATPTYPPFTLCCEMSLSQAQQLTQFRLLVPPDELPSRVYFQDVYHIGAQVVLVFGNPSGPRFTLYQAQQWIYGKLVEGGGTGKQVNSQTVIGEAQVRGQRALWFTGAPHLVMTLDANNQPLYDTARTVDANTLVWETGDLDNGILYRLETKVSLADAVRFAESLQELKP